MKKKIVALKGDVIVRTKEEFVDEDQKILLFVKDGKG